MDPQKDQSPLDKDLGKGTYQVLLLLLSFLFSFCSTDSIAINFVAGKPNFHCRHGNESIVLREVYPVVRMYDTPSNLSSKDLNYNSSDDVSIDTSSICDPNNCTDWEYDRSIYISTIVTEFDLICERAWLIDLVSSFYMAGRFIACLTHGYFADRFGRKKVLILSHVLKLGGGVMSLYSTNYPTFAVSRFIIAVGSTASCMASFVLLVESTGNEWRKKFGVLFNVSIAMGGMLLSLVAYMVRDFRGLQEVYTWPQFSLLLCFVIIDESPRWLTSQGRTKEAAKVLERISFINKKENLSSNEIRFDNDLKMIEKKNLRKKLCSGFFDGKTLCLKTSILWFCWFVTALIYYAFSLNAGRLPGNIYLNTFFITLVEIPANPVTILSLDRFGGRMTLVVFTISAAVACYLMIPFMFFEECEYVVTGFGILGKGLITVSYNTLYVETAETYPTRIRSQAMGVSASFGRLSSMASSFLGGIMADIWLPLPSVIFGSLALISGLSFILFPRVPTGDLDTENLTSPKQSSSPMLKKHHEDEPS